MKGQRYCYTCRSVNVRGTRCSFCKGVVFYRTTSPRSQSIAFMAEMYRPTDRSEERDDL